jgi:hypothetical protein
LIFACDCTGNRFRAVVRCDEPVSLSGSQHTKRAGDLRQIAVLYPNR